jgi:hypothetical protein
VNLATRNCSISANANTFIPRPTPNTVRSADGRVLTAYDGAIGKTDLRFLPPSASNGKQSEYTADMHYTDLTPIWLPPSEGSPKLLAVGWLEPGREYRRGEVETEFVAILADLLVNPWQPAISMGRHTCGFCRLSGGPASFRFGNLASSSEAPLGVSNLWLPANGFLFIAPSLILHYMDAHGYSPPDEFQAAVVACPPMRSMAYLKALVKNGPKELLGKVL